MRTMRGGVWISPWTIRIVVVAVVLALATLFVAQLPDLKRYIKFESM